MSTVERACTSKIGYHSVEQAQAVALTMSAREGTEVRKYRCPFGCGRWHVGHVPSMRSLQKIADAIREHSHG